MSSGAVLVSPVKCIYGRRDLGRGVGEGGVGGSGNGRHKPASQIAGLLENYRSFATSFRKGGGGVQAYSKQ